MVPLVVRSHFSLGWGIGAPERLCKTARKRGFSCLALTDTDGLYGLWAFLGACEREGLRPIIGAEITQAPAESEQTSAHSGQTSGGGDLSAAARSSRPGVHTPSALPDPRSPLFAPVPSHPPARATPSSSPRCICLVENEAGYRNLCRLLTLRHCSGSNAHGLAPEIRQSGAFDLVHQVDPEDHEAHRVQRAIALNSTLSRLHPGDAAPSEAWLADAAEYRRRFEIEPEAITATEAIAERCVFTGPPRTPVFPQWRDPSGRPAAQVLRERAYAGAAERYGQDLAENIVERIEHELALIERKGFSDYFLVVREIVQRSPRTCGRGSGAASIVAYCLGVTNVCPVKFNLYFERFLNPGRTDPPDIDVDFAWDERDGVLEAVLGQYAGHCAMVSNHVLFQPRMLLREIARVFGVPDGEIKRVLDRFPFVLREDQGDADLDDQIDGLPSLRAGDAPPPWPEILRLAGRLTGTPRNLSVHPGGVVITPRPISEYVPLEPSAKGVAVVQWDKDGSEAGGLVKIDLLGNRSLAVIRDAMAEIADRHSDAPAPRTRSRSSQPSPASGGQAPSHPPAGSPIDELTWRPEDDPETQATVAAGRTMGCFYIESPAMRLLQQKTQRGDFEHLVIHSSIIRPAANEYIREYVRRLRGGAWAPLHPLLTDVLAETYGIMVYQEHVALASMALAGFGHEEADRLRKVLSKKDRERHLTDFKQRFADGARTRGVSDEVLEQVWQMMMSFAGYSFCKPHSASYARVSYQSAWLKTHYPAEFMAAVISNQGGFYSTFAYVSEARRLGLMLRPPDVNLSGVPWTGHAPWRMAD